MPTLGDLVCRGPPGPDPWRKLLGLRRPVRARILRIRGRLHRSRLPVRSYGAGIAVAARRAPRWRGAPTCHSYRLFDTAFSTEADTAGIRPARRGSSSRQSVHGRTPARLRSCSWTSTPSSLGELDLARDDRQPRRRALVLQGWALAAVPPALAIGAPAKLLGLRLHQPDLVLLE